jgi:hypothetical protein
MFLVGLTRRGRIRWLNEESDRRKRLTAQIIPHIEGIEWQREQIRQRKNHEAQMKQLAAEERAAREKADKKMAEIREMMTKQQRALDEAAGAVDDEG